MQGLYIFGNTFDTPDEALGLGVGVQVVDENGNPLTPTDDVPWLEANNDFINAGGVVDYR